MDWLDRYLENLSHNYTYRYPPTHPYNPNRDRIAFHVQADSEMNRRIFVEQQIAAAREQELFDPEGGDSGDNLIPPQAYDPTSGEPATVENVEYIVKPTELIPHPLQIWYDASDITQFQPTNPSDGANITQWNDKSRHAHNAHPTGGHSKPQYLENMLNGRAVVEFDGTTDDLGVSPISVFNDTTQCTMYMLVYYDPAINGDIPILDTTSSDLRVMKISNAIGTSPVRDSLALTFANNTIVVAAELPFTTAGWYKIGIIYNGDQSPTNRVSIRINDQAAPLSFIGFPPARLSNTNTKLHIGTDNKHTTHWTGMIAELMIFNKAIDQTERIGLEEFIDLHWGM